MSPHTRLRSIEESAAPLTVADAIAQSLAQWRVGALYGVSGANIEHLHDAVHRYAESGLVSVAARSESGAAFMADAHARNHNTLGVCCSTSGGGMMNLAVGVAESYQEGIPVLAIVGQIPRPFEGIGGFQDSSGIGRTVNAEAMWRAIAKEVRVVRSADSLWEDLRACVTAAMTGRRGPAVLLIPRDVFAEEVQERPSDWPQALEECARPRATPEDALSAIEVALRRAKRPVIIAGPDLRPGKARQTLIAYARRTQIPVVTTLSDINAFPASDPLFLGAIGTAGHPSAHRYLNEEADLLLVAGTRLELMHRMPILRGLERAQVIFVDDDTELSQRTLPDALCISADIGQTFQALLERRPHWHLGQGRPKGYKVERFLPQLATPVPRKESDQLNGAGTLLQSRAIQLLESALPERGQLIFDAGNCAASALHYLTPSRGTRTSIALGMGGMGYAIPAAIGAQLGAAEGSRTTVICGDGAFLLLGMEVHTAVDLGLPILFVVFNNGGHGMCVTRQQLYFESRIECSRYESASIATLARGFGSPERLWVGSAETEVELQDHLSALETWNWRGPALLELVLHHEEVPPFTPFLDADAPIGQLDRALSPPLASRKACAA